MDWEEIDKIIEKRKKESWIDNLTIPELKKEIDRLHLNHSDYEICSKMQKPLALGIRKENDKWIVYRNYEKGGYNIIEEFSSEIDACNLLLYHLKVNKRLKDEISR